MRRRNPFPGVTRAPDRHGKVRWRLRRKGVDTYLPGPYGSEGFCIAYEAALSGNELTRSAAISGTLQWLVERYLGSTAFADLSPSTRRILRRELDWLSGVAGQYHVRDLRVRHIEAIMAKKDGPAASNKARKNLRKLINFGMKKELLPGVSVNVAGLADARKEADGGFHTWTDAELLKYRERHPTGSMARLALELALNTGASRQDLAALGRQNIRADGKIEFRRGKTGVVAILPILPKLSAELQHVPADRMVFLAAKSGKPFSAFYLGNCFTNWRNAAGVPGSLHGLRKAGATALANAGATPDQIRAYLAHKTNKEGATYTAQADRAKLGEAVSALSNAGSVSNLPRRLDREGKINE